MSHFRAILRNTCWGVEALHPRLTRYGARQGVTPNQLKYNESNTCNVRNAFAADGRAPHG